MAGPDKHPIVEKKSIRKIDDAELVQRSTTWIGALRESGFPWRKALVALVVIGIVGVILFSMRGVLTPIVLSLALAYVFDPVVDRLEKRGFSRSSSIAVLLLLLFFGTGGVVAGLFPIFSNQVQEISAKIPDYRSDLQTFADDRVLPFLENRLGITVGKAPEVVVQAPDGELRPVQGSTDFLAQFGDQLTGIGPSVTTAIAKAGNWVANNLLSAIVLLVNFLLIPVFTFYFLRDWDKITARVRDLIPERTRGPAVTRFKEVDTVLGKFLRGQLSVCLILAVLYSIGLGIFGCPMWLVVGVISGFAFLIPYLGTAVGIGLASILCLFHYQFGPSDAALLSFGLPAIVLNVAWFGIVQIVESYLITPKIVGDSTGLHPVVVIVAIIAGAEILGFLGMLLAVPFTAAASVFVRASLEAYRNSHFYRTT